MGCGATYRGPQKPLYQADIASVSIAILSNDANMPTNFPPTGQVTNGSDTYFDNRELIKQSQIIHIKEINIIADDYISGFEISMYLDGAHKLLKHYNKAPGQQIHKTVIHGLDSIIGLELTSTDEFVNSIKIKTLKGQEFEIVGFKGKGTDIKSINLTNDKKAIVGFKGRYDRYLRSLHVYAWKILGR